jgi:hypothetical protein
MCPRAGGVYEDLTAGWHGFDRPVVTVVVRAAFFAAAAKVTTPFSLANEIIVKQKVEYSVVNKQGTAAMQFIFDLIWNQSRSKYLVAIAEQEGAL